MIPHEIEEERFNTSLRCHLMRALQDIGGGVSNWAAERENGHGVPTKIPIRVLIAISTVLTKNIHERIGLYSVWSVACPLSSFYRRP